MMLKMCKKISPFFLAGLLVVSACGCGAGKAESDTQSTAAENEKKTAQIDISEYTDESVSLPDHFENMVFPMEALAVSNYSKDLSYYTEGESSESFWFPMVVLSSLLTENELINPEYDDEYYFYSKDDIDAFASALFQEYADGGIGEAPIDEDSNLVRYNENTKKYSLLYGNVGDLSIMIRSCEAIDDQYVLTYDLIDANDKKELAEFQVSICANKNAPDSSLFSYTISDFSPVDDEEISQESIDNKNDGSSVDKDYDVVDGQEIVDDSDDGIEYEDEMNDELIITRKEALELAQKYMGDNLEYTYKQVVTIGDYQYYDFSVKGGKSSATDVLVSNTGQDVLSGVQNDDGSWSFDQ